MDERAPSVILKNKNGEVKSIVLLAQKGVEHWVLQGSGGETVCTSTIVGIARKK